jgi:hypothetical protein
VKNKLKKLIFDSVFYSSSHSWFSPSAGLFAMTVASSESKVRRRTLSLICVIFLEIIFVSHFLQCCSSFPLNLIAFKVHGDLLFGHLLTVRYFSYFTFLMKPQTLLFSFGTHCHLAALPLTSLIMTFDFLAARLFPVWMFLISYTANKRKYRY